MKQRIVELSGGFHNSRPIRVRVPRDYARELCSLQWAVSSRTWAKLGKHFCGIKGCTCGGPIRATIDKAAP